MGARGDQLQVSAIERPISASPTFASSSSRRASLPETRLRVATSAVERRIDRC
jgi:hypothetical protein